MKKTFLLFLVFVTVLAGSAGAGQQSDITATLAEVQRAMESVGQISGEFVQEKKLEFLNDPVVSHGRFFFDKPAALTWEYVSPAPSGLKVEDGKATVWNGPPGARVIQAGALSRAAKMMADQVMMWMDFKPRNILALYDAHIVETSPLTLKVVPRRAELRKYLHSITVVLSDDIRVAHSVILEEAEAITTLTFASVRFDSGPPPEMAE